MFKTFIFLIIIFSLNFPLEAISNETEKTYSLRLNHNDIGYCSKDGKKNYKSRQYLEQAYLDQDCFSKGYNYANPDFKKEEVFEGDYDFYDNCIDSVKAENNSTKVGRIKYKYYYTCSAENSALFNDIIRSIPLEKFEKYNNNEVAFTDHSQIMSYHHPCNILLSQNNLDLRQLSGLGNSIEKHIKKIETMNRKLTKLRYKVLYEQKWASEPIQAYTKKNNISMSWEDSYNIIEFHIIPCLIDFSNDILLHSWGKSSAHIDLRSIKKEGRLVTFDYISRPVLLKEGHYDFIGNHEYPIIVQKRQIDCDDSEKKNNLVKVKRRKFLHQGDDVEMSNYAFHQYKKQSDLWTNVTNEKFGTNDITLIMLLNFICQVANNQNINHAWNSYLIDNLNIEKLDPEFSEEDRVNLVEKVRKEVLLKLSTRGPIYPRYSPKNYIQKNVQAHDYYGRVNNSLSDPGMQQAILNLNHAQYYFLTALDEDEAAIVSQKFVEALQQGAALGRDDLQKILTQTRQQQLLINKKIKEGHILKVGAKQTFSEGIQYYSKGVMILTLQGFSAYDIFNVMSSDSNIFVRILSGFSLFLKIKDSLFAIPLFLSSTADILSYASQNDIQDIEELQKAKDSIGI